MLYVTGTTLNIESLIGAIMAVGAAMANAILLGDVRGEPSPAGGGGAAGGDGGRGGPLAAHPMTTAR